MTPCIVAKQGATTYRTVWFEGRYTKAHRRAWELAHGPIPVGMDVLHRCDNPPCENPEHLFLGTAKDNMADARAKGRLGALTRQERDEVRASGLAPQRLAILYGVSARTIYRIRRAA